VPLRHAPMTRFLASWFHVAFAAWTLLCAGAFGATPVAPAPAPVQKPAPQTIEPIAVAEILARGDADERMIEEIATQAQQPDPAEKLVAPIEVLAADIRTLSTTFNRSDLELLPAMEFENLERFWQFYDNQLAAWRGELQNITARYSEAAAELAERRAAWEATRVTNASGGLPAALSSRVNGILAEIARAEEALSSRLNSELKLANRGNAVQAIVDSAMKALRAESASVESRLLVIDASPLSGAWRDTVAAQPAASTFAAQWALQHEFLAKYFAANAWKQRALVAAALLLLAVLVWVSRQGGKLAASHPDTRLLEPVLQRPISSWLLVVLLGVLYIDRDAPTIVQQSALFLAPIPVLRLLPRKGYAVLGPWPYVVTALYVFHQLGSVLVRTSPLGRGHLLVTGVLTLAALLWLLIRLRSRARMSLVATHYWALRSVSWLFVAAVLVGMVANAVGSVSLAEAATRGVVGSSYVALVLYAANAVLSSILKLLLKQPAISRFRVATYHAEALLQSLGWLLNIAALAMWVIVTLKSFRVYRPIAEWMAGMLRSPFEFGQISVTLGSVLVFLFSIWVSLWLAKMMRIVLRDAVLPNIELPHGASNSIATLSYYAVATVGLVVAVAATGLQLSQLTIVVGALGVGIGFGLQNIVNNFVSGLILMFERPIQPGDVVEVAGTSGTVRQIGMRATRLATAEGADVVVPNGTLLSQNLLNWTLGNKSRRLDVNVGVAHGSDLKRVLDILMDAAATTPGLAASPAPSVTLTGIGTSSLNFGISAWTNDFDNWGAIRSNMTVRVCDALTAAGIPFPQQDLHLRSISPELRAELAGVGPRQAR